MQMEDIKLVISRAGVERRFGPASGRSHLAGAASGTVSSAASNASGTTNRNAVGSANSKVVSTASGRRGFALHCAGMSSAAPVSGHERDHGYAMTKGRI